MNMAKEIYVTFRYVRNADGELINIYDGVFGSERDATLQLVETYGNEFTALQNINLEREKSLELIDEEIAKQNRQKRGEWFGTNEEAINKAKEKINDIDPYMSSMYAKKDDISNSVKQYFKSVSDTYDSLGNQTLNITLNGDNAIEQYEYVQKAISAIGNIEESKRTKSEKELLNDLNKKAEKLKKTLEDDGYQETYETYYSYLAQNKMEDYSVGENSLDKVGKDNYESWKRSLLATAKGDKDVAEQLSKIAEEQFADLEQRVQNISKARDIFGLSNVNSSYDAELSKQKEEFIRSLSDEDLAKIVQIPNAFANGIDGAKEALKGFTGTVDSGSTDVVTFNETLTAVSANLDILSAVQKDLTDDGKLSIDTMQKLNEAGLDYNTIVGTNGESLRDLIITQLNAEIATKRLALAQAQLNAESAAMAGQDWSGFAETATQLANELAESENTKKIVIGTQYEEKEDKTADTKYNSELTLLKENLEDRLITYQEFISSWKALNAKYYAVGGIAPNEDTYRTNNREADADRSTAYEKEATKIKKAYEDGVITSIDELNQKLNNAKNTWLSGIPQLQDEMETAVDDISNYVEEARKKAYDKRISSIDNQIEITTDTKTDFEGNKLATKEYFQYLEDLITQKIDETKLRINEIISSGIEGNGEQLEELQKQLTEYKKNVVDLAKEAAESEKSYQESVKDAEISVIDECIDKVKEEQKIKEEANQKEIDGIQEKIDVINEENDAKEKAKDLTQAQLDLEKAQLDLEKAKSSYKRKVIGAGGNVEYKIDNEAVVETEKSYM